MNPGALELYKRIFRKNYIPKKVCEIGVFIPEESNILHFIKHGVSAVLVEADPKTAELIKDYFSDSKDVQIINKAIFDYNGSIELCRRESSTFVKELIVSPAIINDNYSPKNEDIFNIECITFDKIDTGDIDLLSIDIEGAEWYVLKYLQSRPAVISLETHGKYYVNSKISEIKSWMKNNGYSIWYKDKSDSVYARKEIIKISVFEKFQLFIKNAELFLIRNKKYLKKLFSTK